MWPRHLTNSSGGPVEAGASGVLIADVKEGILFINECHHNLPHEKQTFGQIKKRKKRYKTSEKHVGWSRSWMESPSRALSEEETTSFGQGRGGNRYAIFLCSLDVEI